ncbi:hypothetical protein NXX15_22205 (plasmid) [Bacteroides fragilis]|nr:hypothetical protein [Bacteroides fragilis]
MEKKDKKQRDIVLSQDNALTTARYKFDLIHYTKYPGAIHRERERQTGLIR